MGCEQVRSLVAAISCLNLLSRHKLFLQVGANDGVMFDPLYPLLKGRSDWRGVLVEPSPILFAKLKKLHRGRKGFFFYNGAIAPSTLCVNNRVTFWERTENSTDWLKQGQVNTINPNGVHNKHLTPVTRRCTSNLHDVAKSGGREFLHSLRLHGYDLVQIDAECMDYEVLKLINFRNPPRFIHYESLNCMGPQKKEAFQFLQRHGYNLYPKGTDDVFAAYQPK